MIKKFIKHAMVKAAEAREHIEFIEREFEKEIQKSISNTKIYLEDQLVIDSFRYRDRKDINEATISLIEEKTTEAIFCVNNYKNKKISVVNFADFRSPGGNFISGAYAQEEYLCHTSTLYPVLENFKEAYYDKNNDVFHELYLDRCLYSEDVVFFNNKDYLDSTVANVITIAAPYAKKCENHFSKHEVDSVLESRIMEIFKVAEDNGTEVLISGAFGCGVFGNDPYVAAKAFLKAVKKTKIKEVIFAIPDRYSKNYRVFEKVLIGV